MKTSIIYIFLISSLLFFSCNISDEEISISATVLTKNIIRPENPDNENSDNSNNEKDDLEEISDFGYYIPENLLKALSKNPDLTLHVISPNKQNRDVLIKNPITKYITIPATGETPKKDFLKISFNTFLEEGMQKLLLIELGYNLKDSEELPKYDANVKSMFAGGQRFNIKAGGKYENINLRPQFNIEGNVLSADNSPISAELNIYPATVGDESKKYFLKQKTDTKSGGYFKQNSIYSIFEPYDDGIPKEIFNLVITANQGNNLGFTIVSKEYKEYDSELLSSEYSCYKYYDVEGSNYCYVNLNCNTDELNPECFRTQSGNLLPGVKLHTEIKVYSKNERADNNKPLISSVNTPVFAKYKDIDSSYHKSYYGNFFISGFNLDKLFEENIPEIPIAGTMRIYFKIPGKIEEIFNKKYPGEKSLLGIYMEYKGPFSLYKLNKVFINELGENSMVLQNRLPFFKFYVVYKYDKKEAYYIAELTPDNFEAYESRKEEFLKLNDGIDNKDSFLGITELEKLISSLKVEKINFTTNLNIENNKLIENQIYPNLKSK